MRTILVGLLAWMACSTNAVHAADYTQMNGQDLYLRFCAACHGATAQGDGPVAASFRVEVPDLTMLTRRAGGAYPRERVQRIIDGRHILGAHGSRTMPVWGEELSRLDLGNPDAEQGTRAVIDRLTDYVASLQKASKKQE
jgi:mono/diheme cytochrome c family protein